LLRGYLQPQPLEGCSFGSPQHADFAEDSQQVVFSSAEQHDALEAPGAPPVEVWGLVRFVRVLASISFSLFRSYRLLQG
jgi:hypothetical protein